MKKRLLAVGVTASLNAIRPSIGLAPGQHAKPSAPVVLLDYSRKLTPAQRIIENARTKRAGR